MQQTFVCLELMESNQSENFISFIVKKIIQNGDNNERKDDECAA